LRLIIIEAQRAVSCPKWSKPGCRQKQYPELIKRLAEETAE
jgi:hypothetical protein